MSSLHGRYGVANEAEELLQRMTPANRRRYPPTSFEQRMRIIPNGIASVRQPTNAECHPAQFPNHSPFAMYAMEPSCGQFHEAPNRGLESGVSPFDFSGRCGPDPMANAQCVMNAYSRGFLPAQPVHNSDSGIGRMTTPPLMVLPVRQAPPGAGRLPPSMFPVQDPLGASMSHSDRRMGAQMAYSGYRSMTNGGDQGGYPTQIGMHQFQMRNPQQRTVAQSRDPLTSSIGLQRMDSLSKRRQQQMQMQMQRIVQNIEISPNVAPILPRGFHRNAGLGNQRTGEDTYLNIQQDVLPQQQDLISQDQDVISHRQELLTNQQSRDPSQYYSSVPPEGGVSVPQSEVLSPKQVAKLKKQITVLLSKMEEYIRVCEVASRRNNHSSASIFLEALIGSYSILDRAMRRDQWTADYARSVLRLIKDSRAPMEGAQQIKQSLDSPLSNTTTALNNHLLDSDEIFNQDSQNLQEAVFQHPTEDSDLGMRGIEQDRTSIETERLPVETPNHRQKVRKNRTTSHGLIPDYVDQTEPFWSHSGGQKAPYKPSKDPGPNATSQSSTQAQDTTRKVQFDQCLRNQSKTGSHRTSRESSRKRESRQGTSHTHQRGSKRRFDQSTNSSAPFQETVKAKYPKEGIPNTMNTVQSINGVNDGLDMDALDRLMDQTGDFDGSWLSPQIQNDFEEHHQEWKFDRKVLSSISTSISELQSCSSLTNKTFLPDGTTPESMNQGLAIKAESMILEETCIEDESTTTEVLGKIKSECDHLFNSLDQPGTFTYHTYIMQQSPEPQESKDTQREASVVLECKHASKLCCDIKLVIGASYPETVPDISFSNASMDLGDQWLRTCFLSRVADLDVISIRDILQLWIELTTAEFSDVMKT